MGNSKKQKDLLKWVSICEEIGGKKSIGARLLRGSIRNIDKRKREQFRKERENGKRS